MYTGSLAGKTLGIGISCRRIPVGVLIHQLYLWQIGLVFRRRRLVEENMGWMVFWIHSF